MSAKEIQLFDEARRIVRSQARFLGRERVDLNEALGRILAEDVASDMNIPPFNKSAMDGYACRRRDLKDDLRVVETIPAGKVPERRVGPGECAKIMTGAIVPEGADCVVQVELTERTGKDTVLCSAVDMPDHICREGENTRCGDVVLHKGLKIGPPHIAILATVGCVRPLVARRPRVGIVATGDELVEPDRKPEPSQIRNSNGYQLCAQVTDAGAMPRHYGIVIDTEEALDAIVAQASNENDVILMSGGVSMGDFDLVPGILKKNGIRLLFEKVAVRPGMPTVFGVSDDVFCFGLPGNPVSTFVIFETVVRPFLLKLMGHDYDPRVVPMRIARTISRKKVDRDSWFPVRTVEAGGVEPVEYHGSAHLGALTEADGLICIPRGVKEVKQGAFVDVRQI